jgi:hypothetical protein
LNETQPVPVFASTGADSEKWLYENSSVLQSIIKCAEAQFANGETISLDEFWRKLEGSTALMSISRLVLLP